MVLGCSTHLGLSITASGYQQQYPLPNDLFYRKHNYADANRTAPAILGTLIVQRVERLLKKLFIYWETNIKPTVLKKKGDKRGL